MWVFTKYGFFSAVCARKGNGQYGQPVDPDRIMVRARLGSHLDALLKRFSDRLDGIEIQTFPGTDYAFRIFVAKPVWSDVLAALAAETDYDNFKAEVASHQGNDGKAYGKSLHDVWEVMYGLQQ
jgi:hypothetical protein